MVSSHLHSHDISLQTHRSPQELSGTECQSLDSVRESLHGLPDYIQVFLFNCFAHGVSFRIYSKDRIVLSKKQIDMLDFQMKRNILSAMGDIQENYGIKISVVESIFRHSAELTKEIKSIF